MIEINPTEIVVAEPFKGEIHAMPLEIMKLLGIAKEIKEEETEKKEEAVR